MEPFLDYPTLKVIWWGLLGVLLVGLAVTDGFDMGVGALLPFVGKTDAERRITINTIAPIWESNQVWLIVGGAAIFAAWPALYALSFSGFYLAMFLVLFALILRAVAFKYRSKRTSALWRSSWDWGLFVGGFIPALIFGVAVGNVLQGVTFHFEPNLMTIYGAGDNFLMKLLRLLNPFALLCGLLSVSMLVLHGAAWLTIRTEGAVQERARKYGTICAILSMILFTVGGLWVAQGWFGLDGYVITSDIDPAGVSNPLRKTVETVSGAWMANYKAHGILLLVPALGYIGAIFALIGLRARKEIFAFMGSKLSAVGIISTVGVSMFPFILPSSTNPSHSLTVWDGSSSHMTLFIMLLVVVFFLPIVLFYVGWAYKIIWGKVTEDFINDKSGPAY